MTHLSICIRVLATGTGAAVAALLLTPLAHADVDQAYGDLVTLYGDSFAFSNSFGVYEDLLFDADLSQNSLSASGIAFGDPYLPGDNASQELTAVVAEGNTIASRLASLEGLVAPSGAAVTDGKELPAIADALALQEQINNSVADLPAVTTSSETNPLLVADLGALYGNELNLDTVVINLGYELADGSPAGLTDDNATIFAEGLGALNDLTSSTDTLNLLADLSSLGL